MSTISPDEHISKVDSAQGNRIALVVGVNNSVKSGFRAPLKYAENDADDVAHILRQPACHFTLLKSPLRGKDATSRDVKEAVIELVQNRTDHDLLLFYFSGHAQPMKTKGDRQDIYLVTYDFDEHQVEIDPALHLSMRWLRDILYNSPLVGEVLVVLDCCYAGNIINTGPDPYEIDLYKLFKDFFDDAGAEKKKDRLRLILTATGHDAMAREKDGHGIMTNLLLQALQGEVEGVHDEEGNIDIHSLYKYIQRMMREQPPNLSGEFARPCILAMYPDHLKNFKEAYSGKLIITEPDFFDRLQAINTKPSHKQPFDHTLCKEATLADLDMELITSFFAKELVQQQTDFFAGASIEDQLVHFGFVQHSTPTYGALLCFGLNPSAWISGAFTRCIYWRGNDRLNGWVEEQVYQGPLFKQFESSIEFLKRNLRFMRVIDAKGSTEQWEIPLISLREALTNALIHREYANTSVYTAIELFADRVEIRSPGDLPAPLTVKQLGIEEESHPRNAQVVRIFYLYNYVERIGSGIPRMQSAMKDVGLPKPTFTVSESKMFSVILQRFEQVPEEVVISEKFGRLLSRGIEGIADSKKRSITEAENMLIVAAGLENSLLANSLRQGVIPPKQEQIAELARTCVKLGRMNKEWLRMFLKESHYSAPETLMSELFPRTIWDEFGQFLIKVRKSRIPLIVAIVLIMSLIIFIIYKLSTPFFTWLLTQVPRYLSDNPLVWIIILVLLLTNLLTLFYWRHQVRILNHALNTSNHILDLDDSLLRLLASWIPSRNHENEMKMLLAELLRDAAAEFAGQVHRGFILLPDQNNEYLYVWAHIGLPEESINRLRFFIGNDRSRSQEQGVAGEVFSNRRLRVSHMLQTNGIWECDNENFIDFHNDRRFPPYRSFVCVPIIGVDTNSSTSSPTCLGVLCFDSLNQDIFDTPESQVVLRVFSRRIATAIIIYRLLPESHLR